MMSETRRKHSKTNSRIPRAPILVPIRINCLYDSNTLAFYNFLLEGNRADINIQWIAIIQSDQTRTVNNPIPKNKTTPQKGNGEVSHVNKKVKSRFCRLQFVLHFITESRKFFLPELAR